MMTKGSQSIAFQEAPYIISSGSVVGKKEGEGPLGKLFDMVEMEKSVWRRYLGGSREYDAERGMSFGSWKSKYCVGGKSDICLEEIYCVRELRHLWEWRHFRFRCLDFMEPVQHQERQLHWER